MPTAAIAKTSTPDAAAGNPVDVVTLNPGAGTADRQVVAIGDPTTGTNYAAVSAAGAISDNLAQLAGTTIDANSGLKSAGTLRVVLATDQPQLTNKLLVTPDSVALPANQSVNVAQLAGTATDTNSGLKSAGTLRVVLATDQPALTNKLLVTPDSVALPANQSVNVAQIAAAATVTAAVGVQKVGVVGNAGAIFDAATGAAVPANGLFLGGRAATANPANATGGNLTGAMLDHAGRLVATLGHIRELIGIQQTNVAVNTETTIITAGGVGVFNDLIGLIITTAGAAAQTITIKDATAGTTRFIFNYPNAAIAPGSPFLFMPSFAIPQAAANANWTVTQSVATACNYTAIFLKNT